MNRHSCIARARGAIKQAYRARWMGWDALALLWLGQARMWLAIARGADEALPCLLRRQGG